MLYQDEQQHEIAKAAAAANTISANASSYARASAIAETSFYEALNELDSLNLEDADRDSIAELIREVHKVDNDESLAKHALKSLIDRAFELGLDAVKVVLPYVWGVLSSFVNGL